ncbi:MAG: carbohydrate ABC transporter permease [Candidatus Brachytrichaceae bacterium NZ_4S206]|jgi:ABC-type glycerol-3-phosphate transport system permease component
MMATTPIAATDNRRQASTRRPYALAGRRLSVAGQWLLVALIGLLFLTPFVWMVSASLKTRRDVFAIPPTFIPRVPATATINGQPYPMFALKTDDGREVTVAVVKSEGSVATVLDLSDPAAGYFEAPVSRLAEITQPGAMFSNYPEALEKLEMFPRFLANTLFLSVMIIIGGLISCSLAAYGFSRIEWPGRDVVFLVVLATIMLPFWVTFVPLFITYRHLGWIDSTAPYKAYLIFIVPAFTGNAFDIFLMRQFFKTIPQELSDAARIDGASEFGIYRRIILPLSKPLLATVVVTTFLFVWNDFQGPLLYLNAPETYTLARALTVFQQKRFVDWNLLMAAAVIFTLPVIVLFFFAQRSFIEGIKISGIK